MPIVRIQLHQECQEEYYKLHLSMQEQGFSKQVSNLQYVDDNGNLTGNAAPNARLPRAEYYISGRAVFEAHGLASKAVAESGLTIGVNAEVLTSGDELIISQQMPQPVVTSLAPPVFFRGLGVQRS